MKNSKKITLIILSIIILIGAIIIFVIIPKVKSIRGISKNIQELKTEFVKDEMDNKGLKEVITRLKEIQNKSDKFLNIFVKEEEELEIIKNLEDISLNNNLGQKINLFSKQSDEKSGENRFDLNIKLNGSYKNLLKYLAEIRKIDYYINIKSISIKNLGKEAENEKENLVMEIENEEGILIKPKETIKESSIEAMVSANFYFLKK